jgi:L-aminopeptidase/D-esterase-like protein
MVRRSSVRMKVRGLRVGHAESSDGASGVTVALFDRPTPVVVDVRGGASATYDLSSLSLDATFGRRWSVFFSGGSLFGLDTAAGVRDAVLEGGGGTSVFSNPHRIAPVSGAALFDLPNAVGPLPDYRVLGYEAARRAAGGTVQVGRVGAGAGALVGKYRGRAAAMRGGVGWADRAVGRRGRIGALVAVNAVGAVRDPARGRWIAGAAGPRGRVIPPSAKWDTGGRARGTTLALLVTDLEVERPALQRIASIAHTGLGGAIVPFHSATDGDVLFVAATGSAGALPRETRPGRTADTLGSLGAVCAIEAVLTAVRSANSTR